MCSDLSPKSLHVGNLANVAYGYCKLFAAAGYPLDLRCHDLKHLMSQPEWDDLDLQASDFPDEFNFYDNTADFGAYRRPEWFLSTGIFPTQNGAALNGEAHATAAPAQVPAAEGVVFRAARKAVRVGRRVLPDGAKEIVRPLAKRMRFLHQAWHAPEPTGTLYTEFSLIEDRFAELVEDSHRYGPEWHITPQMLTRFQPHAWWLGRHLTDHDVIVAYVLSPIYAMLYGRAPYVSVEIGTMRDIPFDGTVTGKLLALAYRRSDHVIITNPDVVEQARRLGLERYSFCPHPMDEDVYAPSEDAGGLRQEIQKEHDAEFIFFAPARQNWEVKGNDRYLRAFAKLVERNVRAVLVIPGWGQEVSRSQAYCEELGIADRVRWVPPQSERMLVRYYQASDCVLDQFILGVFGLITPKAMSCGAVVLTSYDRPTHEWCFPEHPPLVPCTTDEEIFTALYELVSNPERLRAQGVEARAWIERHHSKDVIRRTMLDAMAQAREAFRCRQN